MERSRFGMPRDEEEQPQGKVPAGYGKEDRRAAEGQQQQGTLAHDRTKSVDELSTKAHSGNMDDMASLEPTEGLDRYLWHWVFCPRIVDNHLKEFDRHIEKICCLCFMFVNGS